MKKGNNLEKGNERISNEAVDNRIAAVRDLIFGENMQQYQNDFDEARELISNLKKESTETLADLSANFENKIQALQESTEESLNRLAADIDKKITRLDDNKADRKKLGKALEKIALMLQG